MNDQQLLRYSRHILLPQIGYEGQEKLSLSHALIIGLGGLGCPAALYLAAAGVGTLTLCDFDVVDLSNLQRQVLHSQAGIGTNKALSAQAALRQNNPETTLHAVTHRTSEAELSALVAKADVVLDCSDNFATRYLLNQLCLQHKKPLVSGAAIGFEGQVSVFDFRQANSPCYHCLYPNIGEDGSLRCADNGVFSPLVGMVGSMQAAETLKCLMQIGAPLVGRLLLLDALAMEWRTIGLKKDALCAVCRS